MPENRRYQRGLFPITVIALLAVPLAGGNVATAQTTSETAAPEADGPKVRISKKDCQRLVRYQMNADVAYKPGVDVRGNKVVGADLNDGFTLPLADVFEFNVTKDLTETSEAELAEQCRVMLSAK